MLKTNSKKAIENVKKYVLNSCSDNYTENTGKENPTFPALSRYIWNCYKLETTGDQTKPTFNYWLSGLPTCCNCCYCGDMIGTVAAILEETPEQANRYSNTEAENLLAYLIEREIKKAL